MISGILCISTTPQPFDTTYSFTLPRSDTRSSNCTYSTRSLCLYPHLNATASILSLDGTPLSGSSALQQVFQDSRPIAPKELSGRIVINLNPFGIQIPWIHGLFFTSVRLLRTPMVTCSPMNCLLIQSHSALRDNFSHITPKAPIDPNLPQSNPTPFSTIPYTITVYQQPTVQISALPHTSTHDSYVKISDWDQWRP